MNLFAALIGLAVPAPEYSDAMQRAQLVDATWKARLGDLTVIGDQDERNALRFTEYHRRRQSLEIARDRDFMPEATVLCGVRSRAEAGDRRMVLTTVAVPRYRPAAPVAATPDAPSPPIETPDRGQASATVHPLPRSRS